MATRRRRRGTGGDTPLPEYCVGELFPDTALLVSGVSPGMAVASIIRALFIPDWGLASRRLSV